MAKRKKPPENLSQKQAKQIQLHSSIDRPIAEMTFLERSLLFAEISMISYLQPKECTQVARRLGFTGGKFVNSNGAQAYMFTNKTDAVVVCRGTEPNDWNDIKADLYALMAMAETVGRVHRGFKQEVDDLWGHMQELLEENEMPLWLSLIHI